MGWDLIHTADVLIQRINLDTETDTQRKSSPRVVLKAQSRVMHPQAKEQQRLPANHQNLGERAGKDYPSCSLKKKTNKQKKKNKQNKTKQKNKPADTFILEFQPPDLGDYKNVLFNLWL